MTKNLTSKDLRADVAWGDLLVGVLLEDVGVLWHGLRQDGPVVLPIALATKKEIHLNLVRVTFSTDYPKK